MLNTFKEVFTDIEGKVTLFVVGTWGMLLEQIYKKKILSNIDHPDKIVCVNKS